MACEIVSEVARGAASHLRLKQILIEATSHPKLERSSRRS